MRARLAHAFMTDDHLYARVVALWRQHFDTTAIAERLCITEAQAFSLVNRYVGSAEAAAYRSRKKGFA